MNRFMVVAGLAILLGACSAAPTPTPTAIPTATVTATLAPTATATLTPTPAPTNTMTSTPKPSPTATLAHTRTPTRTATPAGPSPTPNAAQICASMIGKAPVDIYVMYLLPATDLVWDTEPRYFRVGLCNTNAPASTPQGKYKIAMTFPPGNSGATQSAPSPAELKQGFNEIRVGPWIPGLQNHLAICAVRTNADTQVMYNDTPDPFFRALKWIDGSERTTLRIQCGGNFP